MRPSVGVVIPVHNGEKFIAQALQSVVNQNGAFDIHVVCVNDGSTDMSGQRISDFSHVLPSLQVVTHDRARGPAASRNEGARLLDTDFLAFLDHDDVWHPRKTLSQVAALQDKPSFAFALGRQRFKLERGLSQPKWFREEWITNSQAGFLPSALLVRRDFFFDTGGFLEEYRHGGDDTGWFAKVLRDGVPFLTLDTVVVTRLIHAANLSRHARASNHEILDVVRKHLAGGPN